MGREDEGLQGELERLPAEVKRVLERSHFDPRRFEGSVRRVRAGIGRTERASAVELPRPEDLVELPEGARRAELVAIGERALREGSCALVVLAGGMATRMGSVVKALLDALPGRSFLDLRLAEREALGERYGATPPLWLMTGPSTAEPIEEALGARRDGYGVATFAQSASLRLTPEGELYRDADGQVSVYGTGHGDLFEALQKSGLLREFVARGGRYLLVSNVDNLGAGLDPLLVGLHLESGRAISCEVVDKLEGDRGGIPVLEGGRTVIREEFLLPEGFDPSRVRVFNSNSLAFDPRELDAFAAELTYFEVRKQVEGRPVVQFERLMHEATFFLPTQYVRVPRAGTASRFLPVKDPDELRARQAELEALAETRGMLRKNSS